MLRRIGLSASYGVMVGCTVYVLGQLFGLWRMPASAVNLWGVVAMSAIIGSLSLLYDNQRLSYPVMLLLHGGLTFITVLITDILCDWYPLQLSGLLSLLGMFVVIYLLVWLGLYGHSRLTAHQLNDQLNRRKQLK